MRLTVQSFENLIQTLKLYKNEEDYSETLIQQIDTMNAVASF
jgi:hypothetical protein